MEGKVVGEPRARASGASQSTGNKVIQHAKNKNSRYVGQTKVMFLEVQNDYSLFSLGSRWTIQPAVDHVGSLESTEEA